MQGMAILSCWVLGALQGAILILIPEIMLKGELTAFQLAIPLSLGTFIFMFCSGRWGHLLDKRASENKPSIFILRCVLFGFLISQLSFITFLQFTYFQGLILVIALCLTRVVHGVFCSAIIPSAQLTLFDGDQKGERLVWSTISINIGRLTAPLLTFVPIEISYFSLWFIAIVTAIALMLTWFNQYNLSNHDTYPPTKTIKSTRLNLPAFSLFNNRLLMIICTTAVLITLFSSQLQFSLGPLFLTYFSDAKQASEMTATLLFSASASALVSLFILYRPLTRYPKLFLSVIVSSLLIGCVLFVLQKHFVISVVLLSSALSMAPAWYTAIAMHSNLYNKARISAAVSQSHTLGNALGGLLGGVLLTVGELSLLLSFILIMVLILIAWFMLYQQSSEGGAD
ncbi:permease [Psychromonas arctica]|uniref:permease n=1 Tax=Psychromonas arctica TaxID=168275 RepID=UPI002FD18FA5